MAELRLSQRLQQKMVLTPQLRQRIEMLQMTSLELAELIQEELLENPVLEEVQTEDEIQELAEKILEQNADSSANDTQSSEIENSYEVANEFDVADAEANGNQTELTDETKTVIEEAAEEARIEDEAVVDSFEEMDLGREFLDYLDPGYKTREFEFKDDAPSFEQFLPSSETLSDHLIWQLQMQKISDDLIEAGKIVIGNLDGDGRLKADDDELSEMCGYSIKTVEDARQLVMRLEPIGCGARDVKECLLVQLRANDGKNSLATDLVENHFENLPPHRLQKLSKATGKDINTLDRELEKIRKLNPYPGKEFSLEKTIYISPEIYIEKVKGEYIIYFTDNGSPRLRISRTYQKMLEKEQTNRETRRFIKGKVRSAVDLLRNIEHRRKTIYRVVESIIERQRDFLDNGVEYIKPMMLKNIAEDIGMHLSTISRVVNRKYAHTPQGVIELRRFFTEGMLNEDGEEVSTRILKLKISKMVEDEDTHHPLTDDTIAKLLGKGGVKISRRTIAKYRDQMKIPGSRERKSVL